MYRIAVRKSSSEFQRSPPLTRPWGRKVPRNTDNGATRGRSRVTDVAAAVEPEDVTDAEVKAGAEEVIDEEEVAIAAGASAKAVEASWTVAPDPLVPARASADASSSKEAELGVDPDAHERVLRLAG